MKEQSNNSTHEGYFEWWLEEAKEAGFVLEYSRPEPIVLIPKQTYMHTPIKGKARERTLFREHTYKPDFEVVWQHRKCLGKLIDLLFVQPYDNKFFMAQGRYTRNTRFDAYSTIDIKPDRIGPKQQHSAHTFPFNQKMMYDKLDIYVQKVVLYPASNTQGKNDTLFTETWTPKKLVDHPDWRYKKDSKFGKKGESRIKWPIRTIEEFLSLKSL